MRLLNNTRPNTTPSKARHFFCLIGSQKKRTAAKTAPPVPAHPFPVPSLGGASIAVAAVVLTLIVAVLLAGKFTDLQCTSERQSLPKVEVIEQVSVIVPE